MGDTEKVLGCFQFESRETCERAKKESEMIRQIKEKADMSDAKTALKVYNKAVSDRLFETAPGYCFLLELRQTIEESGLAEPESLAEIPVKDGEQARIDTILQRPYGHKYEKLYEGQRLLNRKYKIALAALIILLAGFVIINFRFEYSIFTYFTDYKAHMEEEIVDKYEEWQTELEERDQKLNQAEGSGAK